ncbi:MAG: sodium:solute symporter family protein [Pseudomonadota bacterium]
MLNTDGIIVLIYLALVLAIGLLASRGIRNLSHFSVAGRSFSSVVVFATLSASFIGGGFTMGNAEKVFTWGIVNIFALWGFSLKEILVATLIAPRMDSFSQAIFVGDIMEFAYGKTAKLVTGCFAVLLCAGIVGAQVGATGYIFELFLGIPRFWGIFLGFGIVVLYSTVGGMRAVVFTDLLQFAILAVGIPLTLIFGVSRAGGLDAIQAAIPAGHLSFLGSKGALAFVSLFLTFVLGETLVPPYVQRLLIGKSAGHTARGTLYSGLFSIPFFAVTGGIGLVALTLKPGLDPNLALPYVIQHVLPMGLKGLVVAGIIAVVMSSADSFLNGAAVAFSNDVVQPLRKKPLSDRKVLLLAKFTTLMVGALAIIFALKIKSILDILIYAYHFWAPVIVIPLAAAFFGIRADTRIFLSGCCAGLAAMVIWNYFLNAPGGVEGLIVGVLANGLVFAVGLHWNRSGTSL